VVLLLPGHVNILKEKGSCTTYLGFYSLKDFVILNHLLLMLLTILKIITNGRYKSFVHRAVVNAERARLSVATFYDPPKSRKIFTVPLLVSSDEAQKYRDVVYGDYVSSWYSKGPEVKHNIDALLIQH
jgi:hypothetical protein